MDFDHVLICCTRKKDYAFYGECADAVDCLTLKIISFNLRKTIVMKKIFFFFAVTVFFLSCTGETREQGDPTNRDSTESRSTDGTIMEGTDTSASGTDTSTSGVSPAAPGATNAQY